MIQLNDIRGVETQTILESDKNLKFLYDNNKDIIELLLNKGITNGYQEINKLVLYKVVKTLIKAIEKIPALNGPQKKELLIEFIVYIIKSDLNIREEYKADLILVIEDILPDLIDTLVEVWQEIDWGVICNKLKKCFRNCRCCSAVEKK